MTQLDKIDGSDSWVRDYNAQNVDLKFRDRFEIVDGTGTITKEGCLLVKDIGTITSYDVSTSGFYDVNLEFEWGAAKIAKEDYYCTFSIFHDEAGSAVYSADLIDTSGDGFIYLSNLSYSGIAGTTSSLDNRNSVTMRMESKTLGDSGAENTNECNICDFILSGRPFQPTETPTVLPSTARPTQAENTPTQSPTRAQPTKVPTEIPTSLEEVSMNSGHECVLLIC